MVSSALFLISTFFFTVAATNDWTKPCLSGVCEYDLPTSAGSASGTLKIWGSQDAIADITPAAGWEIIGCSPDVLEQDIRLVCKEDADSVANCAHLYTTNAGAVGKIVRLPENCGQSAFAVVSKSWVPQDQSIPADVAAKLVRRDGTLPQVKALHIDTSFSAVDTSSTAGPVNFAIRAANIPGANGELDTSGTTQTRRSRIYDRGLFDFIEDAVDTISSLGDFNVSQSKALQPVTVDKSFNLVDQSVSCPPVNAALKIDVNAKANAMATIGVAATGTLLPPKIDDFAIITSLTADLDGTLDIQADVTGTLDSGKILLFQVGIPGLDFPGILTIGPSLQINAQAIATLELNLGLTVGVNYHVGNAELVFPPNSERAKAAGGVFTLGDTPIKLSASPSVNATGTIEAHLIPSLNLGLSALGGVVDAGVFLELDASVIMTLGLNVGADGTAVIARDEGVERDVTGPPSSTDCGPPVVTQTVTVRAAGNMGGSSSAASASSTSGAAMATPPPVLETSGSTSFGGCFEIDAGLDVNAGADADFFGLFNAGTKVELFSKKFDLFKVSFSSHPRLITSGKCFGSQAGTRRSVIPSRHNNIGSTRRRTIPRATLPHAMAISSHSGSRRAHARSIPASSNLFAKRAILNNLLCPATSALANVNVVDEVVKAAE
ncbi:hypothetical protein B0H34DRAFT_783905 [Crassisporium funariophilum]|nr:hypothetical protein B0H34DRAFT_783905 [Crassisporium funariophilum]